MNETWRLAVPRERESIVRSRTSHLSRMKTSLHNWFVSMFIGGWPFECHWHSPQWWSAAATRQTPIPYGDFEFSHLSLLHSTILSLSLTVLHCRNSREGVYLNCESFCPCWIVFVGNDSIRLSAADLKSECRWIINILHGVRCFGCNFMLQ